MVVFLFENSEGMIQSLAYLSGREASRGDVRLYPQGTDTGPDKASVQIQLDFSLLSKRESVFYVDA